MSLKAFMSLSLSLVIVVVIFCNSLQASPAGSRSRIDGENDAELTAGKYEGDMLISDDQEQWLRGTQAQIHGRTGLISEKKRWPNRIVTYKIEGDFDAIHRDAIKNAIDILESRTCLRFEEVGEPATTTKYVAITSAKGGCFSAVGYLAKKQQMNLENYPIGDGCFRMGSILHEFMHVLGFYHEQSSPDRDRYVNIIYDNIIPGKEFNFDKYSASVVTDLGVGYDYESVMHFSRKAFSVDGEDTIVPLDPTAYIGQRVGLSRKDIDKINTMYKCPVPI